MRFSETCREAWRNTVSGITRLWILVVALAAVATVGCLSDASWIVGLERDAAAFRETKSNVSVVKSKGGVDGGLCERVLGGVPDGGESSGALRSADGIVLLAAPDFPLPAYEVTEGILGIIDPAAADGGGGVWVSSPLASRLGVEEGSMLAATTGGIRVSHVYDWAEDGRDARLGYAVLVPVTATDGEFDECWAQTWPAADVSQALRQSVDYGSSPAQATLSQLNYSLGDVADFQSSYRSRPTRFNGAAVALAATVIGFAPVRRRKLVLAGDLHAREPKACLLARVLIENSLSLVMAAPFALSVLVIFLRMGGAPDAQAILLVETRSILCLAAGLPAGTLLGGITIRERDLFRHFKNR